MQWPLYGFMGLWFYLRMVRVELHRDPDDERARAPTSCCTSARASTRTGDPELAAYNAYLAELNEQGAGPADRPVHGAR